MVDFACQELSVSERDVVSEPDKRKILGLGLDCKDEIVRVTRGKNYHLVGGSHDTHECMQEKCLKFNEKLDARGKELTDLGRKEFLDIASECDMNVVEVRVSK